MDDKERLYFDALNEIAGNYSGRSAHSAVQTV